MHLKPPPDLNERRAPCLASAATDDWLTPGRFAFVLGALVVVAFPQVLLGWETFVLRDFGLFVYPAAQYQRECFWRGALPFWNPYNNCGVPFLAQWNTMPLYPPALIYLLLPLSWSLGFFDLLHLWFAGMGMYFLAHRWTGNRLAASLAGLVFSFNGLSLNLLMWPSHIATLSWMPWVVLTVEQGWREGGRKLVLAGLVGALQMLAGGPETILLTWLVLLVIFGGELLFEHKGGGLSSARRFCLLVALVAALAAAQLLPFLDLTAHSQRERGYADTSWSLPARGWANFFVPMVFGSTWNQDVFFQYGQYWTSSYYLGIGTVLLALLAVWTVRQRRTWLLATMAALAFVCALGDQTFVYAGLRRLLPQLTLMTYPVKFVTVIIFAGPLLAGYALTRLRSQGEANGMQKRLLTLGAVLLGLVAGILVWARRFPQQFDDFPATLRNGLGRAGFLTAAVVLILLLRREQRVRRQMLFSVLLLMVTWLDLWTHEPNQNPTLPPGIYTPGMVRAELAMKPEPALGEARVMVSPVADEMFNRLRPKDLKAGYVAKRLGYFSDCNLLDEVPKVNGFFSLYPRESAGLNSLLYGGTNRYPRLEDFLSVAYVTAPGEFTQWEARSNFLPWATAGQKPVFLEDTNTLRGLAAVDFEPRQLVFLPPEAAGSVLVTNQTQARVLTQKFSPEVVTLEVDAAAPALVVISQTYEHNWRAYVDGKRAPLLRANYAFQAVQVPEGRHHVRLAYENRAFQIGAVISGLALSGCLLGWLRLKQTRVS